MPSLPNFPPLAPDGSCDAIAYGQASIAREIVSRRIAAGMTQVELAKRAGVRLKTITLLEAATHVPKHPTVVRIDNALKQVEDAKRHSARGRMPRRGA